MVDVDNVVDGVDFVLFLLVISLMLMLLTALIFSVY